MISGTVHAVFPMADPSWVGEARRHAAQLASDCSLDAVDAGRLAIVVTELGTNLVRHAQEGRLWLSARLGQREVEVIAVDQGPGIHDVERSLRDGFSTGGTAGTGLGAVRRLSQHFDVHSSVPGGTVIVARVRAADVDELAGSACAGAVSFAAPGEQVCGDGWAFAFDGDCTSLLVVDGLGHGPQAAEAAAVAIQAFEQDPLAAPRDVLARTHEALRRTRGAAVLALQGDAGSNTVRSAGAGNVVARIVSGLVDRTLLCQHGTAGVTIRTPEEVSNPWPPHALVIAFSDGIETRWKAESIVPVLGRDPTLAAALLARDHCRGRDDATVAVFRRKD